MNGKMNGGGGGGGGNPIKKERLSMDAFSLATCGKASHLIDSATAAADSSFTQVCFCLLSIEYISKAFS